ncbi:MAG: M23 family metallopeptidase [Anaerolineae bacterium]
MSPESRYKRLRNWLLILPLMALVAVLVYFVAAPDDTHQTLSVVALSPQPTLATPIWTPAEPFAQVDPALVNYLQYGQPAYGVIPLQVLGADVPPVGAYLPRSGNMQFNLVSPTPAPVPPTPPATTTLIPVFQPTATIPPTRTPRPTPLPGTDVPTDTPTLPPSPTSELVATVLAFAATISPAAPPAPDTECAPQGLPVEGFLTQRFHSAHPGIDLASPLGNPVLATQSGFVDWADWNTFGYGNLVIIKSGRFITYYAHNTSFNVQKGDFVTRGTIIAFSGSTGHSSGPHVHYETRIDDVPVDPLTFEARGYVPC